MTERIGITQALGRSWEFVKKNPAIIIGGFIIYMIPSLLGSLVSGNENNSNILTSLILSVISVILSIGVTKAYLNVIDGKSGGFEDLLSVPVKTYGNLIVATVVVVILVILGFLALVIPGIYLALRFSQVANLIVDKNMGVLEAMRVSTDITRGNMLYIFEASIVIGIFSYLGFIALIVGALVTIPMGMLAMALIYRSLLIGSVSGLPTEPIVD